MKSIRNKTRLAGVLYLCLLGGGSYAEDRAFTSLQRLSQSSELADYARSNKNAAALIVAAQMRRELAMEQRTSIEKGAPKAIIPASDLARLPNVDNLLAEARAMGQGDTLINRLADNVEATSEKGRERGPLYEIMKLLGGKTERLPGMSFNLEKRAEIYVEGTENLSLVVLDSGGRSICRDDRNWSVAYCWWPQGNGAAVTIEVTNKSSGTNTIRLVTN